MELFNNSVFTVNAILIALFLFFTIRGYIKGIVSQFFSLFSLAIAIFIAWFLYVPLGNMFKIAPASLIPTQSTILYDFFYVKANSLLWFVIIFISAYIFIKFLSKVFNLISKVPLLSSANRVLGALFGFVNYIVISLVFISVLSMPVITNGSDLIERSHLKYTLHVSSIINPYLENSLEQLNAFKLFMENPQQATVADVENLMLFLEKNKLPLDMFDDVIKELGL